MKNKTGTFIILTPGFAASESDNNCLPMQQQLVRSLSHLYPGIKIVILAFQYPYHTDNYDWNGVTVIPFNGKNKGGLSRLLLRRKIKAVLKQVHKRETIIGLFSFWLGECAFVGKSFGQQHNIPHYCWLLGQDARKQNKYPKRMKVVRNELVALSDFLQNEFERNYKVRPFRVIPPGIENRPVSNRQRDIDIIGVGSLIPLKQFYLLVEIVAYLKTTKPNSKAVIAGAGPEQKNLDQLISRYGLQDNVTLTGELAHDDVLKLMERSKVLLHPSSYEGFSGVCMEALSCGAHVVSFCKPMENDFEQWHVVKTKEEMEKKVSDLLQHQVVHRQIIPYYIEYTAKQIMSLYL